MEAEFLAGSRYRLRLLAGLAIFLRFGKMPFTPRRSCSHSATFAVAAMSRESLTSMTETALAPGTGGLAVELFQYLGRACTVAKRAHVAALLYSSRRHHYQPSSINTRKREFGRFLSVKICCVGDH